MGYRHFLWSPPIWVWEIAHIMGQNGGKIGLRGKNPVILSNIFQPGDIMRFIDAAGKNMFLKRCSAAVGKKMFSLLE